MTFVRSVEAPPTLTVGYQPQEAERGPEALEAFLRRRGGVEVALVLLVVDD